LLYWYCRPTGAAVDDCPYQQSVFPLALHISVRYQLLQEVGAQNVVLAVLFCLFRSDSQIKWIVLRSDGSV
jgi:hypothetical protein